jgi:hypothetical protein
LDDGSKVAKVLGVFGANGAGKSNLIQPIAFLSWFLTDSFKQLKADDSIPFSPHFATEDKNTVIEVALISPDKDKPPSQADPDFYYYLEFNQQRVIKEELKSRAKQAKYLTVFSRTYEQRNDSYIVKKKGGALPTSIKVLEQAPHNCSLISYVYRIEHKGDDTVGIDLKNMVSLFGLLLSLNDNNLKSGQVPSNHDMTYATNVFSQKPEIFNQVKYLLKKYDLGITDVIIEQSTVITGDGREVPRLIPFCLHEHQGKSYRLSMLMESSGTQSAYRLLASIALRLQYGGACILDEFDYDLHPQLTEEIINLFKDQSTNPANAQLIFTSHSPEILKLLRKQHVYLTEKDDCTSEAWRADEIEGLRERDNLYAKYISGALGGVPSFD